MSEARPWESQTVKDLRDYADGAGIDLSHLPAKAPKRDIYAAINRALADRAVAAVDEVTPEPVAMTDAEKAAAYDRILAETRDELADEELERVDDAMRRWREPDDDDVDVLDAARDRTGSLLPTKAQWTQIETMGDSLATGQMVKAKKLNTAADVKLILLAARDLGVPPTMAVQQIHVIEGKPSLSAQLMVALVRNAGHSIVPVTMTAERAVAKGTRLDEVVDYEFTIEEARAAGLANKDNWKHYPKAMLWARAVSGLCRILFPDVLAGLTYTPEELGDDDWNDDAPRRVDSTSEIDPPDDAQIDDLERARITAAILERDEATRAEMLAAWKAITGPALPPLSRLPRSDVPRVEALLARFPVEDLDGEADEAEPPGSGQEGGVTYATGQGEQTVTSPLLNGDPEDAAVICTQCGTLIGDDGLGDLCATCASEPF